MLSLTMIDVMLGNTRRSVDTCSGEKLKAMFGVIASSLRQMDVTRRSDGGMLDRIMLMNLAVGFMRCRWITGTEMIGRSD